MVLDDARCRRNPLRTARVGRGGGHGAGQVSLDQVVANSQISDLADEISAPEKPSDPHRLHLTEVAHLLLSQQRNPKPYNVPSSGRTSSRGDTARPCGRVCAEGPARRSATGTRYVAMHNNVTIWRARTRWCHTLFGNGLGRGFFSELPMPNANRICDVTRRDDESSVEGLILRPSHQNAFVRCNERVFLAPAPANSRPRLELRGSLPSAASNHPRTSASAPRVRESVDELARLRLSSARDGYGARAPVPRGRRAPGGPARLRRGARAPPREPPPVFAHLDRR